MVKKIRILKIILCFLIIILLILYILFRSLFNFFLPWNTYIVECIAKNYVNDNIDKGFKQLGTVRKEIYNGCYVVSFSSLDNNFFEVYVDSGDFQVIKDTFSKNLFNNIVHSSYDKIFEDLFGKKANYTIFFVTEREWNNVDVNYRSLNVADINKHCKNIYLYINYYNLEDKENNIKLAREFTKFMSFDNFKVDKVFLRYYNDNAMITDDTVELIIN